MANLPILHYPHPILRQKAEEIKEFDNNLDRLITTMFETMYAAPGVGLAAPQIGQSIQVAVIDVSPPDKSRQPLILINPKIVESAGISEEEEGCLSVPGFRSKVKRYTEVSVEALDPSGKINRVDAKGLLAVALQHEIDHLNGTLILDRASGVKKKLFIEQMKKQTKIR